MGKSPKPFWANRHFSDPHRKRLAAHAHFQNVETCVMHVKIEQQDPCECILSRIEL